MRAILLLIFLLFATQTQAKEMACGIYERPDKSVFIACLDLENNSVWYTLPESLWHTYSHKVRT